MTEKECQMCINRGLDFCEKHRIGKAPRDTCLHFIISHDDELPQLIFDDVVTETEMRRRMRDLIAAIARYKNLKIIYNEEGGYFHWEIVPTADKGDK